MMISANNWNPAPRSFRGASRPWRRLAAAGIMTGVLLMPVLPFIEDNAENITAIVSRAHDCGASYILASFGMTLRDRQRAHYYAQLDRLFPGLRKQYERRFGDRYSASANRRAPAGAHLSRTMRALRDRHTNANV